MPPRKPKPKNRIKANRTTKKTLTAKTTVAVSNIKSETATAPQVVPTYTRIRTPSRRTIKNRTPTPYSSPANQKFNKPVIFFDNDARITLGFKEKCSGIITIKVYESDSVAPLNTLPDSTFPPEILKNPAYNYYKSSANLYDLPCDIYGGLQQADVPIIKKWLKNSDSNELRTAIFDFDRTISIIDGFDPKAELKGVFSVAEHMEFLCGGEKRIKWLQNFFLILASNNVRIKICTNNPGCSADRMISFMNVLGVELNTEDIVCAVVEADIHENLKNANIHHSSKYKITALTKRGFC